MGYLVSGGTPRVGLNLKVVAGKLAGHHYQLDSADITIGRSNECDITLDVAGASRQHARLRITGDRATIADLKSRNGTIVNSEKIQGETLLRAGDRIGIGASRCLLCDDALKGLPRLQIMEGPLAGQEFQVDGPTTIGRQDACDIQLPDRGISREHCKVEPLGAGFQVIDGGSRNGTALNGERINGEAPLRSGDLISVGDTDMAFIDGRIDDLVGNTIGPYRLSERIGAGSLGVVYDGRDLTMDIRVAVKVIDPAVAADAAELGALFNAARAQSRTKHENISTVLFAGPHDDRAIIVTPLTRNGSLDTFLRSSSEGEPAPTAVILAVALDAGRGLQAMADGGSVHRALSPRNILVDGDGMGLITDASIGQVYEAGAAAGGNFPWYISPEEAEGETITAISNQYSLGAILYHLLAGVPPFDGESASSVAKARTLAEARPLLRHRSDLPTQVVATIARMMERRPERRYETWDACIDALEEAISASMRRDGDPSDSSSSSSLAADTKTVSGPLPSKGRNSVRAPRVTPQVRPGRIVALALLAVVLLFLILMLPRFLPGGSQAPVQDSKAQSP